MKIAERMPGRFQDADDSVQTVPGEAVYQLRNGLVFLAEYESVTGYAYGWLLGSGPACRFAIRMDDLGVFARLVFRAEAS